MVVGRAPAEGSDAKSRGTSSPCTDPDPLANPPPQTAYAERDRRSIRAVDPSALESEPMRNDRGGEVPCLRVEGLTKSYGDAVVLDGVTLHVAKGEVLAVIGPSGSGKSTRCCAA